MKENTDTMLRARFRFYCVSEAATEFRSVFLKFILEVNSQMTFSSASASLNVKPNVGYQPTRLLMEYVYITLLSHYVNDPITKMPFQEIHKHTDKKLFLCINSKYVSNMKCQCWFWITLAHFWNISYKCTVATFLSIVIFFTQHLTIGEPDAQVYNFAWYVILFS